MGVKTRVEAVGELFALREGGLYRGKEKMWGGERAEEEKRRVRRKLWRWKRRKEEKRGGRTRLYEGKKKKK